jgi:uncharacterized membrane protein
MNDLNHMDVVPRIIDNSMKITKEQLKNDKKKNEVYNKPSLTNNMIHASTQKTEQSISHGFFSNVNTVLVIIIIVLLLIIIYMIYLVYKYKKNAKKTVVNPTNQQQIQQPVYEIKQDAQEDYSQYIQSDDEVETISMKSNNSNNTDKKIKIIVEEDNNDTKSEINESIISNIELESISSEELVDDLEEADSISIIDKLQQDLKD